MNKKNYLLGFSLLVLGAGLVPAHAGPFEIAVSPSRLEVAGKTGQRIGQSLEIQNIGQSATELAVRTLDWTYSERGELNFHDELLPNSCRPWVTLERSLVSIPAKGKRNFRLQIQVPPDATRTECRFMVALEGVEPAHQTSVQAGGASLNLPVSGRIAVAVYVALNGAEPVLQMKTVAMENVNGRRLPVAVVTNQGDAHGRLDGFLEATDAKGKALELIPEGTPILPGQTRRLALLPKFMDDKAANQLNYPIKANGSIDWSKGSFKINNAVFK